MSDKANTPVFPQSGACSPLNDRFDSEKFGGRGMSHRDYIAVRAMQGMLANNEFSVQACNFSAEYLAHKAYQIADFMLKAGEK